MDIEIQTNTEYAAALAQMDEMIDDYDTNRQKIAQLADAIERWEDHDEEFSEFNAMVAAATERDAKG